jgi:hypothetical protein
LRDARRASVAASVEGVSAWKRKGSADRNLSARRLLNNTLLAAVQDNTRKQRKANK